MPRTSPMPHASPMLRPSPMPHPSPSRPAVRLTARAAAARCLSVLALAAVVGGAFVGGAVGCGPAGGNGAGGAGGAAGGAGGVTYGSPAQAATSLTVADLFARAAELDGKQVRVEGTVADVCSKRGCWIKLAEETGPAVVTFKVEDGVMVFPMDAKGKWAVADGVVKRTELTLEQTRDRLKHEAEEAGKPFDPATVTAPLVSVRLAGIGAVIRDRK